MKKKNFRLAVPFYINNIERWLFFFFFCFPQGGQTAF
jgi:hypothetical protein